MFVDYRLIFLYELVGFGVASIYMIKKINLPLMVIITTQMMYMTSPALVLVQGISSAIYPADFIGPLIIIKNLFYGKKKSSNLSAKFLISLTFMLIIVPIFSITLNILIGKITIDSRAPLYIFIWLYRNYNILILLNYGINLNFNQIQYRQFIELNIIYTIVFSIFGIANYVFNINLSVFEALVQVNSSIDVQNFANENRFGNGFLGLFRASLGQWCATLIVLYLGTWDLTKGLYKYLIVILVIVMFYFIAMSQSRAGVVGALAGYVMLIILEKKDIMKIASSIIVMTVSVMIVLSNNDIYQRVLSITEASDGSSQIRLFAWEQALRYLSDNIFALLFGIGPGNDEGMVDITGTYGAHNEFVDVLLRGGLFNFLFYFLFLYKLINMFINLYKKKQPLLSSIGAAMISVIVVNIFCSFTQSHLYNPYATYNFGIFLYWLYSVSLGISYIKSLL